jgi:hypothetical protein
MIKFITLGNGVQGEVGFYITSLQIFQVNWIKRFC